MNEYPYYYAWKNNSKRISLYQRACRIVASGALNSIMIEFANGQREVVSRHSIRKLPRNSAKSVPLETDRR